MRTAKFGIGQVVRHRLFEFRGVIFDVDPVFDNTEEWWLSIPEHIRPAKDQPFYHLFAENAESEYVAYVSEQNLLPDESGEPLRHPQINEFFDFLCRDLLKSECEGRRIGDLRPFQVSLDVAPNRLGGAVPSRGSRQFPQNLLQL